MKKNFIIFILFFLSTLFLFTQSAQAEEKKAGVSATFAFTASFNMQKRDNRIDILEKYLEKMDSPLTPYAQDFVTYADEYDIPWNLVAGISGTESTLGKAVPYNCNNAWGFGIYGNHMTCFASYPEAIKTVSKALRENYMNKWHAQTVEEIGSIYAASPTWAAHTSHFMEQMEEFRINYENTSLSISI